MRFCLSKSTRIDTTRYNIGVGGGRGSRFRGATFAMLLRNGPQADGIPKSRDVGRASWKPRQSSPYRHKVTNVSNGSGLPTVRSHITYGCTGAQIGHSPTKPPWLPKVRQDSSWRHSRAANFLKLRRLLSVTLLLNLGFFATAQSSFGTTFQGPGALPDGPHTLLQVPAPHAPAKRSR